MPAKELDKDEKCEFWTTVSRLYISTADQMHSNDHLEKMMLVVRPT